MIVGFGGRERCMGLCAWDCVPQRSLPPNPTIMLTAKPSTESPLAFVSSRRSAPVIVDTLQLREPGQQAREVQQEVLYVVRMYLWHAHVGRRWQEIRGGVDHQWPHVDRLVYPFAE